MLEIYTYRLGSLESLGQVTVWTKENLRASSIMIFPDGD